GVVLDRVGKGVRARKPRLRRVRDFPVESIDGRTPLGRRGRHLHAVGGQPAGGAVVGQHVDGHGVAGVGVGGVGVDGAALGDRHRHVGRVGGGVAEVLDRVGEGVGADEVGNRGAGDDAVAGIDGDAAVGGGSTNGYRGRVEQAGAVGVGVVGQDV